MNGRHPGDKNRPVPSKESFGCNRTADGLRFCARSTAGDGRVCAGTVRPGSCVPTHVSAGDGRVCAGTVRPGSCALVLEDLVDVPRVAAAPSASERAGPPSGRRQPRRAPVPQPPDVSCARDAQRASSSDVPRGCRRAVYHRECACSCNRVVECAPMNRAHQTHSRQTTCADRELVWLASLSD